MGDQDHDIAEAQEGTLSEGSEEQNTVVPETKKSKKKHFISTSPKKKDRETIELPRLKIVKFHYLFLAIFMLAGFMISKSAILYFDAYYQYLLDYRFSGLPAILLIIACLIFIAFSIDAARAHSKDYDTNITNVFEYMKRQKKTQFSYTVESDPENDHFGVVRLKRISDDKDSGESEIVVETVPSPLSKNTHPVERRIKISDIREVRLINQARFFNDEQDFIEKNEQIRNMLRSDRQQLIAFVSAYFFAMSTGFFLALIF